MKKLVLIACALAGLIIPAPAEDVPTYRLGQTIKWSMHWIVGLDPADVFITVNNVITEGPSPRKAGYRSIQASLSLTCDHQFISPLVELEDKQENRWAAAIERVSGHGPEHVFFFDIPEGASDRGNLTILLFTPQEELIAKVAAHF